MPRTSKVRTKAAVNEHPTASPPAESGGFGSDAPPGLDKPRELTEEELAFALSSEAGGAPTLQPPQVEAAEVEGITLWQSDKRVTALWSGASTRNSWTYIYGVGWKKLHNGSDSAITSMTMMLAHARHSQSRVDYREEADGMIYEVYVW